MNDVRVRPATVDDFAFLAAMLGEAAVWRPDKKTPTADEVMADPRFEMYLAGWPRPGDHGLIAEDGALLGAAWFRTYTERRHGYGFVAADIPELSIAVVAPRRHEGIGRLLLLGLIEAGRLDLSPLVSRHIALSGASAELAAMDGPTPPGAAVVTDFLR